MINERIQLQQLLNLYQYNGYLVTAVTAAVQGFGAQVSIFVNGYAQASVTSPTGFISINLPSYPMIGRDLGSLELIVQGVANVGVVTLTLQAP